MIPLPNTYRKYGYDFELVERKGDVAIFSQKSGSKIVGYEVFEVLKNQANTATFAGVAVDYPAKEAVPPDGQWGKIAFSPRTLKAAYERMKELLEKINSRQVKQVDVKIQNVGVV